MAALALCSAGVLIPAAAQAHFMLTSPTSWWSQASDGTPQKTAPCGNEGAPMTAASKVVTNFQPGQQVPVTVQATIAHPGWYRVSLKQGASSTQTTSTLADPPTLGASGSAQQCTPAFMDNPVWSTTQPVLADKQGLPAGSTSTTTQQSGTKTFMVTIPSNATCTVASPCTLQVLMFMTDHNAGSCNYHHCADISVVATSSTGGTSGGTGGAGGRGGAGGAAGGAGRGGAGGRGGGAGGGAGGMAGTSASGSGGSGATTGSGGTTGAGGSSVTGTGGDNTTGAGGSSDTTGTGGSSVTGTGGDNVTGAGGSNTTGAAGSNNTGAGGSNTTGAGGSGTGTGGGSDSGGGCAVGGGRVTLSALLLMMIAVVAGRRRRHRR
jgi:hypothetical protein